MQLLTNEIHIWKANLDAASKENRGIILLSQDERERADRFHSSLDRDRFIAGRSLLRTILSFYTNMAAEKIIFSYTDKQKPFLDHQSLQFNVSHSEDMIIIALTLNHDIGIDIEKVNPDYKESVAQRFFSPSENATLLNLIPEKRAAFFYRIWASREALVKATGKGISSFDSAKELSIDNQEWSLHPLEISPDFQAAVATNQVVKIITYWELINQLPVLVKREPIGSL
jgi:4'-phosphopantetheinyl transferase